MLLGVRTHAITGWSVFAFSLVAHLWSLAICHSLLHEVRLPLMPCTISMLRVGSLIHSKSIQNHTTSYRDRDLVNIRPDFWCNILGWLDQSNGDEIGNNNWVRQISCQVLLTASEDVSRHYGHICAMGVAYTGLVRSSVCYCFCDTHFFDIFSCSCFVFGVLFKVAKLTKMNRSPKKKRFRRYI